MNRLLVFPIIASAPTWVFARPKLLGTAEIIQELTNHFFQGKQNSAEWVQRFEQDGTTNYSSGRSISKGRWKAEANLYCSLWSNESRWGCWQVFSEGVDFSFRSVGTPSEI